MSENKPQIQTAFKLEAFFITNFDFNIDISNVPEAIVPEDLKIDLKFDINYFSERLDLFAVIFQLNIKNETDTFSIVCQSITYFNTPSPITDEFKEASWVKINAPAIAFPFLRSYINTAVSNAGYGSLYLPSFNFAKLQKSPQD